MVQKIIDELNVWCDQCDVCMVWMMCQLFGLIGLGVWLLLCELDVDLVQCWVQQELGSYCDMVIGQIVDGGFVEVVCWIVIVGMVFIGVFEWCSLCLVRLLV